MKWIREEYIELMTFGKVERPMFCELFGPLIGLEEEWRAQGASPEEIDLTAFDFDYVPIVQCGANASVYGGLKKQILEDTPEYTITLDHLGRKTKLLKGFATLPLPLDFPVTDMDSWLKLKHMFEFNEKRIDYEKLEEAKRLQSQGVLVRGSLPGGYDVTRELMGEENLSIAYYEDPELMEDIMATISDTSFKVLDRVSDLVQIDNLMVHEDMAGKSGSLIGPKQVLEHLKPYYRRTYDMLDESLYEFDIKLDEKQYNDTVEEGKIISQNPPAGSKVNKNGSVYVVVSLGKKQGPAYLPELKNKLQKDAVQELEDLDAANNKLELTIEPKFEYSETVEKDAVIRTDPAAGTELNGKVTVTLYVSLGRNPNIVSEMPVIVGQQWDVAKKILENQGLGLIIPEPIEINSEEIPAGTVISSVPAEGEPLQSGQTVTVTISAGPKMCTMQKLMGMTYSEAFIILQNIGYNINFLDYEHVYDSAPYGTILAQSIDPNTEVKANTPLMLTVSKGPAPQQSGNKTKTVTITLQEKPEENCKFVLEDSRGIEVASQNIAAGTTRVTVTLTGSGKQTYNYYYSYDGTYYSYEVNFDE